ncbi:hypothetical protein [Sphaerisporangium siamense]|uniref:Uncharacterized protein n=1 Tax=Sphaerisporangium siamense TaxID=795645 RepID=A0A7W7D753_9ACTN|nr:hypothetical protein [Sphaerisporangium siamense]MBB4700206.1 hypothetical protein [Sphaerisporangium siamense]
MFTARDDSHLGRRVFPCPVPAELAALVPRAHHAAWPVWLDPGPRMLRDVLELCRLQTARGLTVLSWLASGHRPEDVAWLWPGRRLTGPRQRLMYAAADAIPGAALGLVVADWTWIMDTRFAGQVMAPYLAGTAYPDDGFAAAQATVTLTRVWDRQAEARAALGAAWAACRTIADWCKAAELHASYGHEVPVFTYPRGPMPRPAGVRPWISRLFRLG